MTIQRSTYISHLFALFVDGFCRKASVIESLKNSSPVFTLKRCAVFSIDFIDKDGVSYTLNVDVSGIDINSFNLNCHGLLTHAISDLVLSIIESRYSKVDFKSYYVRAHVIGNMFFLSYAGSGITSSISIINQTGEQDGQ